MDQAVSCAKAPEMEPVIAKPLAMAAMTDTYETICRDEALAL